MVVVAVQGPPPDHHGNLGLLTFIVAWINGNQDKGVKGL